MMAGVEEVSSLLALWEEASNSGGDITSVLRRLAEIFEAETEAFLKQDPDPFDDRHPSRSQPDCTLGHMLKTVFRNERIVDEMVKNYCVRDDVALNTETCRLLLDILPGLENVIFQEEGFVPRLLHWAENAPNPLQSYATGLLAAAMDVPEIAANYREKNNYFVPLMIKRLRELSKMYLHGASSLEENDIIRPPNFTQFGSEVENVNSKSEEQYKVLTRRSRKRKDGSKSPRFSPFPSEVKTRERKLGLKISPVSSIICESSNSSWSELGSYVIGSHQVFPLTLATQQRYILQYLTPLGEYQDLIGHVIEQNTLPLILQYVDLRQNRDVRLAFDALKYLASLLCHKKIAIEFLNSKGLQLLLKVPRPSMAATGVSICFYYLSYIEEIMERICLLPTSVISDLVSYAVWLLECSHDSSRCHATMFFGFAFAFRMILLHFDEQDGLRKLFNVVSTLDVFVYNAPGQMRNLSDDQIWADRQTTRHVCATLKRYFEAHLIEKVEQQGFLNPGRESMANASDNKAYKAVCLSPETIDHILTALHNDALIPMCEWKPVEEFRHLDGVSFLLELIFNYFDLNYSGRTDTVKCALDVLKLCSLTIDTQLVFCEKISSPDYLHVTGMSVLLTCAEGEILPVPDVQKSALQIIINCVCSKLPKVENSFNTSTPVSKKNVRPLEDLLSKMWKGIRIKNGINILINLVCAKSPLTDADSIRALACKALCGLARSETVKQIISKLPLLSDGQLFDLMKEPVLHDKCQDHVQFCKYGLELMALVTGAPATASSGFPVININKSEVVAKTEVVYNDIQLIQLISDHLSQKGYAETVSCLQREMVERSVPSAPWVPDDFPVQNQSSFSALMKQDKHKLNALPMLTQTASLNKQASNSPLRIIRSKKTVIPDKAVSICRLQKPQACSGNYVQSPAMKRQASNYSPYSASQTMGLHSIVTEYLRKQHSLCKNPMLACPPFDLFTPHKCPDPHRKQNAPTNSALRIPKREIFPSYGGIGGAALDRKFVYSRYRMIRTFRGEDARCDFVTCSFLNYRSAITHPRILVGTLSGDVIIFNLNSAQEELSKECHRVRGVAHIQSSEKTPLVITSDGGRIGNSSLWNVEENFELVHNFTDISHLEYGKRSIERMVGSKQYSTSILDTATLTELQNFSTNNLGNGYTRNRATFDYADELVLSDGLIWDVRSGKMIHKLDKFNSSENGVFHPNGREIISNSEIWDIRTFKLLRTVNGLDQTRISFNPTGTVIYGIHLFPFLTSNLKVGEKTNTFVVYDSYDYSNIATVEVKKPVFHVSCDLKDRCVALIENQTLNMAEHLMAPIVGVDCICKLYEIGRTKEEGDEDGEEESDGSEEGSDGDEDEDDNNESRNVEENDEEHEDSNWITTSDSGGDDDVEDEEDDDDDVLFALNTDG